MNRIEKVKITRQVESEEEYLTCMCGCETRVKIDGACRTCFGCDVLFPSKCLVQIDEDFNGDNVSEYAYSYCRFCYDTFYRFKSIADAEIERHNKLLRLLEELHKKNSDIRKKIHMKRMAYRDETIN